MKIGKRTLTFKDVVLVEHSNIPVHPVKLQIEHLNKTKCLLVVYQDRILLVLLLTLLQTKVLNLYIGNVLIVITQTQFMLMHRSAVAV